MRRCSVRGCTIKHFCRGYCRAHYDQWRRNGKVRLKTGRRQNNDGTQTPCSVENCYKYVHHNGLCYACFRKSRKTASPICVFEGCILQARCRGMCNGHYAQWLRDPQRPLRPLTHHRQPGEAPAKCCGPKCDRDAEVKGMCHTHWTQMRRYGKLFPIRERQQILR